MTHLRTFELDSLEAEGRAGERSLSLDADGGQSRGLPALPFGESAADADLVLGEVLGEGGMGVVHLAHQRSLDREVVVKRVRTGAPPRAAAALVREARVAGRLEHPNIVPIHALGSDAEGAPALVMKRIEGVSWATLLSAEPAALDRHLGILQQVCNAVSYAHAQPGDRFPSAAALHDALAGFLRDRGTLALVAAAKERIDALRHQLEAPHAPAGLVDALFTEARFGLRQAAAATGQPTAADAELAALIPELIRWKIHRGDLGGAESLLDQADDPALRAELDATRTAQDRALALAAGLDPARFVRMRRAMIIATFSFFAATTIGLTWALEDDIAAYDHRTAFFVSLFAGSTLSAGAVALRWLGPDSLFNRVLSSSVPLSCVAVITNRALAWQTGVALPAMLAVDLLLVATAFVGSIGWLAPRLQWAAVPYVAGVAWIALAPDQAVLVFAGAVLAGIATLLALAWGSDDGGARPKSTSGGATATKREERSPNTGSRTTE